MYSKVHINHYYDEKLPFIEYAFPGTVRESDRSIDRVIKSKVNFNTYVSPKGLKELRIKLAEFLNSFRKYKVDYSKILVSSCSQQSFNLIAYSLLQEGDTILIEQPTYC